MARLELYIPVGRQKLRCGYTTGTCAAAAAAGAAARLLTGETLPAVRIITPAGVAVEAELLQHAAGEGWAACAVRKDGGDDPDVTDGALIFARVERTDTPGIIIDGGEGVGRVTLPGLDQPVGAAAINSTPRRMIAEQLETAAARAGYTGGLRAVISVPEGEALAKRTFNPRLGIVGGISILGTSGIVKPMSEAALLDSLYLEMDQRRAAGTEDLLLTPGNYGESFAREVLGLNLDRWCMCSNYLGAAIDHAAGAGFRSVLVVGHLGKLIKAAAGCMNTHSKTADARRETLTAHAALAGADGALLRALFDSPTTDAGVELLKQAGLLEPVMASIGEALDGQLKRRAGEGLTIEALFFSNQYGILGKTPGAERLLALHRAAPDGETAGG
ncbi:cobalt-precorrin-5B (C(1))-methyltransferase CbiD [uncultured Flavonifractor sp.]|uniref:cobalt-precorrin-5B (C(1))-methyltransferase CbiD n=1 Tax=uncultured Flavonifractor sp. TaxID=1193534 RepID=UPI0025D5313E|nr:cobalt-precorrin-5B (C(1))-methyltransferase CbiD [uncultured Flavonifractor sp.]